MGYNDGWKGVFSVNGSYITGPQLCDLLHISPPTLRNWRRRGLPCLYVGRQAYRYNPQEVSSWLSQRKNGPRQAVKRITFR